MKKLEAFEFSLILFPTVVVMLASSSFLFGGTCSLWQWWCAALITAAACFVKCRVCTAAIAGTAFFAWLAIVWIVCGLSIAPGWFDEIVYHFPAVRLLADGWNPILERDAMAVLKAAGLTQGECKFDHILFMPKVVWVFSAVAYFFTGDLWHPLLPLVCFFLPAVTIRVWRALDGANVAWKILAIPLLYCIVPNSAYVVDAVVALSGIGLLLSFEEALSGRRLDIFSLTVYSFWMMAAKPAGLVHGCLFWAVFLAFAFFWKRMTWRVAPVIASTAIMLAIACASPYLTSVHDYRHPFYPKYSFDEKRFPVRDITGDFLSCRNADAARMGYFGQWIHAFVSRDLACSWYRWRLKRKKFKPKSQVFTPPSIMLRTTFWLSLAWVFFAGRKSFRPSALMVLVCVGAVPGPMLGYVRYVPWWLAPALFAYIDLSSKRGNLAVQTMPALVFAWICSTPPTTLPNRLGYAATLMEHRARLSKLLSVENLPPLRPCMRRGMATLKLLRHHCPELGRPELLPIGRSTTGKMKIHLPCNNIFEFEDEKMMRKWRVYRPKRLKDKIIYVGRTWLKLMPRSVVARIATLMETKQGGGFVSGEDWPESYSHDER